MRAPRQSLCAISPSLLKALICFSTNCFKYSASKKVTYAASSYDSVQESLIRAVNMRELRGLETKMRDASVRGALNAQLPRTPDLQRLLSAPAFQRLGAVFRRC